MDRRSFIITAATGIVGAAAASSSCAANTTTNGSAAGAVAIPAGSSLQDPASNTMANYKSISLDHLKGGLDGLSAGQLEEHGKLYDGYVKRTNVLMDKTAKLVASGAHLNDQKAPTPEYCELKRRFGFEFNGMVLHEYYFQNLKKNGGDMPKGSALAKAAERSFGSVQNWWEDFKATSKAPGIGWVICYQDPRSKRIINSWVTMHEEGNVAGYGVILALDLWEHAFVGDYKPTERGKYLAAFEKNIDWDAATARIIV
ncbi:MAG: superoxide dismutase [Planctomycetota bacterium]